MDNRDVTSFSAVVRWNPPNERDLNGIILSYTVNFVAVSMVNTPSGNMGRRRRQMNVVRAECILGGVTNIDRNITVEGTSANLTDLSKCTFSLLNFLYRLCHQLCLYIWCIHLLLAPDTVYEFRVLAETTVGAGPFSTPRSFTTPEHGIVAYNYVQLVFQFLT